MLPSRLFRNTGIPPALRSLVTPHPNLPSTIAVQLRFRIAVASRSISNAHGTLGRNPSFSTSPSRSNASSPAKENPSIISSPPTSSLESTTTTTTSQALPEKMVPKLSITFTCTVPDCGERSTHQFTKQAYEKGIVLVQCPGCKNRHLIADHLGWFKDSTQEGKLRTIEDILKAKGEKVRRGIVNENGDLEYAE
ncbi:hypothetical protein M413DRAFT_442745 [Hebeloma cylindrosporum]|uniref:DNL-type domain-containing protein n=1 Tax=Hebeloma cylindrosporum TaxID=76867 RepID=A0A0C2Y4J4_HEBCY|nr:hypothetical protein M413DRAFT_442745 [Hebeloma cylindrosporum h7]